MRKFLILSVAIFGLLMPHVSLNAHHAFTAEFDGSKAVEVRGTLVKVLWINPHSWLYIDEKKPDGTVVPWEFELGGPSGLIKAGWRKDQIPVGLEIVVRGHPAKSGGRRANAREVTFPDGREMLVGSSAPDAPDNPNRPK